jgi:small-conductance mechanosensitive channel
VASILGIPTTSFITILASCGVAVGLALQGALSNLAGGVMILLFKPFKVGDYIEASGEAGPVLFFDFIKNVRLYCPMLLTRSPSHGIIKEKLVFLFGRRVL